MQISVRHRVFQTVRLSVLGLVLVSCGQEENRRSNVVYLGSGEGNSFVQRSAQGDTDNLELRFDVRHLLKKFNEAASAKNSDDAGSHFDLASDSIDCLYFRFDLSPRPSSETGPRESTCIDTEVVETFSGLDGTVSYVLTMQASGYDAEDNFYTGSENEDISADFYEAIVDVGQMEVSPCNTPTACSQFPHPPTSSSIEVSAGRLVEYTCAVFEACVGLSSNMLYDVCEPTLRSARNILHCGSGCGDLNLTPQNCASNTVTCTTGPTVVPCDTQGYKAGSARVPGS